MANIRVLESTTQGISRREQDQAYTAKKRALESQSETSARPEQDRAYSAKRRALECPTDTLVQSSNHVQKERVEYFCY